MAVWLFSAIILQLACAGCAAKLDRPVIWLQIILLIPFLGSLAYLGFEIKRGLARVRPARPAPRHSPGATANTTLANTTLGWLGYRAVRARTVDSRRALAEECMYVGRYADARLLFESCMVGRHSRDPRLVAGLKQATALMAASARPPGVAADHPADRPLETVLPDSST